MTVRKHDGRNQGRLGRGSGATVILGVAASDSHAVANHLIAYGLRAEGYQVVNLGTCTPISEFSQACQENPHALAVVIGSLNGHVHEDLRDLAAAQEAGLIHCPVIVGGNLSVGSHKDGSAEARLRDLGVSHVLAGAKDLSDVLAGLAAAAAESTGALGLVELPLPALAAS
jgi:methylaspartate mutase sigma subunit